MDAMLNSAIARARRFALAERRAEDRHDVKIDSIMFDSTSLSEPVTIINMSQQGLLATAVGKYMVGAYVTLELPLLGATEAVIRWAGKGLIGCELIAPIGDGPFSALLNHTQVKH
jgi:hypothetical protein